jgi:hypothetical protein
MTTDGAFLSTLFPPTGPAVAQLPALSQIWRLSVDALPVSTPAATCVVSKNEASAAFARPDCESLAVQAMLTSEATHWPSGEAHAIVGPVVSRLIVMEFEAVPPALVAVQVKVVPAVSEVTVSGAQPDEELMGDSVSVTLQFTRTSLVYQPLLPTVPLTFGVMTGGVVSTGESDVITPWSSRVITNCSLLPADAMPDISCRSIMPKAPSDVAIVSL